MSTVAEHELNLPRFQRVPCDASQQEGLCASAVLLRVKANLACGKVVCLLRLYITRQDGLESRTRLQHPTTARQVCTPACTPQPHKAKRVSPLWKLTR
jgi:hypothetical protein